MGIKQIESPLFIIICRANYTNEKTHIYVNSLPCVDRDASLLKATENLSGEYHNIDTALIMIFIVVSTYCSHFERKKKGAATPAPSRGPAALAPATQNVANIREYLFKLLNFLVGLFQTFLN